MLSSKSKASYEKEKVREILLELKPYSKISSTRFYLDILLTALVAWGSIILLSLEGTTFTTKVILCLVAYLAFYRGLAFIHEVVHFQKRVKHLDLLYNVLFGFPIRLPLYTHLPHRQHHLPTTFATLKDPEYLHMAGKGVGLVLLPFLAGLVAPLLLVLRFGVLPLLFPIIGRNRYDLLFERASTIVVNPGFRREVSEAQQGEYFREDLGCALFFLGFVVLLGLGVLPLYMLGIWYVMFALGSIVNIWRARIAHRYDNKIERLSPFAQIRDSVTIEGGFLCWFWAPIGLRYHSLHHLAPNIPYYNLKKAHRTLCESFPGFQPYEQTRLRNVFSGVRQFYGTVSPPAETEPNLS